MLIPHHSGVSLNRMTFTNQRQESFRKTFTSQRLPLAFVDLDTADPDFDYTASFAQRTRKSLLMIDRVKTYRGEGFSFL